MNPITTWNKFIGHLTKAEKAWKQHRDVMLGMSSMDIELLNDTGAQKFLGPSFNKASFDSALPRIAKYWLRQGEGVTGLLLKVEKGEADGQDKTDD